MKRYVVLVLVLLGCCVLNAAEPATNLLSIYLVGDKIDDRSGIWAAPPKLSDLKLIAPAVISSADFVTFDTTERSFTITPEAAKRLVRELWRLGKGEAPYVLRGKVYELVPTPVPYVLMASDERICSGMFWNTFSSLPPRLPGPTIIPDDPYIRTNPKRNVKFSFGSEGSAPDPCKDSRVLAAVPKSFAYKEH